MHDTFDTCIACALWIKRQSHFRPLVDVEATREIVQASVVQGR